MKQIQHQSMCDPGRGGVGRIPTSVSALLAMAAIILVSLAGCVVEDDTAEQLPYFNDTTLTPIWVAADSVNLVIPHRVASFELTDQHGRTATESLMDDRITVVDFFFTSCPSLCPKLTRSMLRIQDSVGDATDVQLLSISVTPERDSVSVLSAYADANGIDYDRWRLLTGDRGTIYGAARNSFFADVDTGAGSFLHSETFYLLDGNRRIRGVYNGTLGTEITQIVQDIELLRSEAARRGGAI